MAPKSDPTSCIPEDLRRLMRWLPEASSEEREELLTGTDAFFAGPEAAKAAKFPPLARIKWYLAREHRLDDLIEVIRYERENPSAFRVRGVLRPYAEVPGVDTGSLPTEVTRLRMRELPMRSKATEIVWEDDRLVVRGYAFVANVPVEDGGGLPRLAWLRRRGARRRMPVKVRPLVMPRATRESGQALHRYDGSGFEIRIDPEKLKSRGEWKPGEWQLTLALPFPGGWRPGPLGKNDIGSAGHSGVRALGDGARLVTGFSENALRLTVDLPDIELVAGEKTGDSLRLALRVPDRSKRTPEHLRVSAKAGGEAWRYPVMAPSAGGASTHHVEIPLVDLTRATTEKAPTEDFHTHVEFADGTERRLTVHADFRPSNHDLPFGREIAVTTDGPGLVKLHDRRRQPVVDRAEWTPEGALVLEGDYTGPGEDVRVILRHGQRFEEHEASWKWADGRFVIRVTPDSMPSWESRLPLRQGRWYLSLRDRDGWDHTEDVPVKLRADLVDTLPLSHRGTGRRYSLDRRFFDRIFLASGSALAENERGGYHQRRLREVATPLFKQRPLRDAIFYNSFGGKQFSDSPRAIYEEMVRRGVDAEHIWAVSDDQVALPDGVRAVEWHSEEWHEALARSRWVVTNVGLGDWYEKRPGQCVVQTWHGTPLKRIGADLLGTPRANRAYIASLPHRFRQFDHIVSPNAFTTPIMRDAFCCEGDILESGYPRNDVFHRPERAEIIERVRRVLGIPEGKKVVLYAPTWRDDQRHTATKFKLDLRVDLAAARRELGEDHVFLFRKHPKILDAIPGAGQGFVWDVSAYPDIAELYLIADILITDYSSVLFDYAHSERPMLFFTYDLEHYRDTLRGFYFDFTEKAPGPLLKTSEELVAAIRDIEAVKKEYADRYDRFLKEFCEPRDGLATARVVERMLSHPRD
ncbi:CDP-glycerol glycerophosphotransferase family protein [Streptomyces sp. ST2-7A]|uniref:CDP-glycerol glycerophosphotransferase family protein n=1 Tax=Streptomyces sp. ST2-7A TaxID=2907214 RepID=UPI001F1C869E|nr:CDP-glycerol glycerophosphotransferase family protein [Streptomyces sp. ST2-7A]MCE7079210.1 CDP-glycerol glycerophosphotransferase family protein [Streptomyces sp. ST2-7A]